MQIRIGWAPPFVQSRVNPSTSVGGAQPLLSTEEDSPVFGVHEGSSAIELAPIAGLLGPVNHQEPDEMVVLPIDGKTVSAEGVVCARMPEVFRSRGQLEIRKTTN